MNKILLSCCIASKHNPIYNACMNDKHINQLEVRIEQLVEGAFTNLFRKRISTHDIALKLARSMETHLRYSQEQDSRPIAPDEFTIQLHPSIHEQILNNRPNLPLLLSGHLVELATSAGYQMLEKPIVRFIANPQIAEGDVAVFATHSQNEEHSTQAMSPIKIKAALQTPKNPHLIINGERIINLTEPVVNVGRSDDNHIMIEDPLVSRQHLQIRLRFGVYTLFDVNSRAGTKVNNVNIVEHRLQPGDVIQIGNTKIIYLTDDEKDNRSPGTTQTFEPVDQ